MNIKEIATSKSGMFAIGAVIIAIGSGIWKFIKEGNEPIETVYDVQSKSWSTSVQIYKKKTVQRSGWTAPNGAKIINTQWEFKEMKKVPVGIDADGNTTYKEVPEHATKYYYEVEEYVYDRTVDASGSEKYFGDTMTCPHYPDVTLADDEKIDSRSAYYSASFRNVETGELKNFHVKIDVWNNLVPGNRVIITTTKWAPNTIKTIRTVC